MIFDLYQHLPLHIDPVAFSIGSFAIRWYALMYLVGFTIVYGLLKLRVSKGEFSFLIAKSQILISNKNSNLKSQFQEESKQSNLILDWLLVAFFSAIIGGRLGYVLFYNWSYFAQNPIAIISPYDFQTGQYVGLFGMSYHGALVTVILGSYIFIKKKSINFFDWADFVIPAAALGYFFGRVGNFLNGELYGRITTSPLGVYFRADPNHLRHPSQLYEAFLEGILLFVILWQMRNKRTKRGELFAIYLIGYGLLRIIAEQFRQPDPQIGFLWNYFTLGQILCLIMIFAGAILLIPKNEK